MRVLVTPGTGFAIYLFALVTMTDDRFVPVTAPAYAIMMEHSRYSDGLPAEKIG